MSKEFKEALEFVLPGRPVPWARTAGSGNRRYTPEPQRAHKELVQYAAKQAMKRAGTEQLRGAVYVELDFHYKPPRKRAHALPLGRPDIDNLTKQMLDGMNDVVYVDDAQVAGIIARKLYAADEYTTVTVYKLTD